MNKLIWPLALAFLAAVTATGAVLVTRSASPPPAAPGEGKAAAHTSPVARSPAPAVTTTATVPASVPAPNLTDPWAVVSAYYRDVRSHQYRAAWVLISSGAVTGQTYQQFVAGYACTGAVHVTELNESGDHVSFALAAADDCTGQSQHYTGTDTVHDGKIVAADVTRTG
jgi:hypothetical protein